MRRPPGAVWGIAVGALLLFTPAAWWGLPIIDGRAAERGWAVDDETPLGTLAEVRNLIVPSPDRNLGYPLFYTFASAAVYAPYLVYLRVTGRFAQPSAEYPYGFADATSSLRTMALLSRVLTLLFASAIVVAAYGIGRTVWDHAVGVLGAVAAAVMYPMAYYSRTGNVDAPMLGLAALALMVLAIIHHDGMTRRRAMAFGVLAGLSLATKEAALGLFLAMPYFVATSGRNGAIAWRWWRLAALVALAALAVGSGLAVDPERYVAHLRFIAGLGDSSLQMRTDLGSFPMSLAGHWQYLRFIVARLADILTLPGFVLAVAGVGLTAWQAPRKAALALPCLTYLAFVFVLLRWGQLRYLLPAAFVLTLYIGVALVAAWRSRRLAVRTAGVTLGALALGLNGLRYADLTHAMLNDSRYAAADWLATRLEPGDRIEYFGAAQKLPRLPAGVTVTLAAPYHGMFASYDTSAARADDLLQAWETRRPDLILVIPDHSSRPPHAPYDATVPPSLFHRLESDSASYRRVAMFQTPPLLPWVRRPPLDYPVVNPPVRVYGR